MRTSSGPALARTTKIDRSELQDTEETFVLRDVAKLLWPIGTAAEIASRADCSVRNVELYMSGQQKWSGDALTVIVTEILERNRMRNVRVKAR